MTAMKAAKAKQKAMKAMKGPVATKKKAMKKATMTKAARQASMLEARSGKRKVNKKNRPIIDIEQLEIEQLESTPAGTPVVGILSGISYISGIDYYKGINEQFAELFPKTHLMPCNPLIVMVSVDCAKYAEMLCDKQWQGVIDYLAPQVRRLVAAGASFLVLASNTAHICASAVAQLYPSLPILHIADCTAAAIKAQGLTKVGLLGTEPTMREAYLKDRLALHGIEVIVPERDEDLHQIFQYIMKELGQNIFKADTRAFFVKQVQDLARRGGQGVILGCTEIELLIQQEHIPDIPVFMSANLHIAAAAEVLAGKKDVLRFGGAWLDDPDKKVEID